mmetsp:Transcript_90208/g.110401  ORF Transcript_90208/g.110401 Transcript_90208/m.110401 type:complete len:231 (+) Transcript_90208:375-1067(+)
MLAKAISNTTKCTFFNVSPSIIISKYRGDSSKLIKILFDMAKYYSPSVIFFDEIDCIGSQRGTNNEHESSRQLKSELLIQMDGIDNDTNNNVIVLAATNHPWLIDEALRRRLEKRIYIPLPDFQSRNSLFKLFIKDIIVDDNVNFDELCQLTDGYNCQDISLICRDASMSSMREKLKSFDINEISNIKIDQISNPVTHDNFLDAIKRRKSSVANENIHKYLEWEKQFGSL